MSFSGNSPSDYDNYAFAKGKTFTAIAYCKTCDKRCKHGFTGKSNKSTSDAKKSQKKSVRKLDTTSQVAI